MGVLLLALAGRVRAEGADSLAAEGRDVGFYQELSSLGERQEEELEAYRKETRSLPPAQRLSRRRALMIAQRKEMAALENKWRDRINPDQRRRWLERRQDRKRRLETLQHQKTEHQHSASKAPARPAAVDTLAKGAKASPSAP
jgi:hypothetical protein